MAAIDMTGQKIGKLLEFYSSDAYKFNDNYKNNVLLYSLSNLIELINMFLK